MDKRTETLNSQNQKMEMASDPVAPADWWMYHADQAHSGNASTGSNINAGNIGSDLKVLHDIQLDGPVLSVPALVKGYVYLGIANYHKAAGGNGGAFFKINIQTGAIEHTFNWDIAADERDTHGFTGMGSTPAIADGKVYFSAFNGKLYCLDQDTLELVWMIDFRYADAAHNQPITNDLGMKAGYPPAAGWSSPVVANGKVYLGMGEGENPFLYSFVYCIDAVTGKVIWIYCTCKYEKDKNNQVNLLPAEVVKGQLPAGFTLFHGQPVVKGCSVWGSIAYNHHLNRLYCPTGNPQPDSVLPSLGYSNGLLSLDAATGEFKGFFQATPESHYRASDADVDVGGSPTLFTSSGSRLVAIGCKNGGLFILAADTLQLLMWRQLLPYYNNGLQIPTVDPHSNSSQMNPSVTNAESNATSGENYSGTYSTSAIYPGLNPDTTPSSQRLFIGIGGPNYHSVAPGIDCQSTPFMRAIDPTTLADAWPMDDNDPQRYSKAQPPMYTTPAECGLSSPAVVNDVVFCSTTKLAIYAFDVADGTLLWQDHLGQQTGGYNGGYGYTMGPAVWGDYVVVGGLIFGRDGGVLRIYRLETP
jgi:outer membrane protein assembly factor BamB